MFSDGAKLFNMQKFLFFLLSLQNFRKKMQNILSAVLVFQEKKIIYIIVYFSDKIVISFLRLKNTWKKISEIWGKYKINN